MTVRFMVLDRKYYDGTEAGYEKAWNKAIEVIETNFDDKEDALNEWEKKYPPSRYTFDDIYAY